MPHPIHALWRSLPQGLRRAAFTGGTALLAPRPEAPPPPAFPGMGVCGEVNRASGMGEAARLMLAALTALGLPVWPIDAAPNLPGEPQPPAPTLPPANIPLLFTAPPPMLPAAFLRLPRHALRGRRVIAHWAWELPTLPPAWHSGATLVHDIWATSRFTAQALEQLAPGRIRVVPHPVAISPPKPSAKGRAAFGLPENAFIVLTAFSLASSFARKNPLAAIAAFRQAFGDREDCLLVLKLSHTGHWPDDLFALRTATEGAPNIRLMDETLSAPDQHALTQCADVLLSLHRSEGFGLVPAEAMLLGVPVMATDWSATAEFIDATSGIPVPYRLVPARDPRGVFEAPGALWAEADTGYAAERLRDLRENPDHRRALAEAGRKTAQTRLGIGPLRDALAGLGIETPS
jgi:glycosyltransferase involved in cell wall biosynthesis